MNYFLYRLIPPRPTFDKDMSEAEAAIMGRHVAYWQRLVERGTANVFGPVSDPSGAWNARGRRSSRGTGRRCAYDRMNALRTPPFGRSAPGHKPPPCTARRFSRCSGSP